jgi:hypothetical protein
MILGASALLAISGLALARGTVVDGRLQVEPAADNHYTVEYSRLGKAEFFGYVGDFVDSKKITGILLRKGEKATDEQKHVVAITAAAQHIQAFIEEDGKVMPLVDPIPGKPAAPPAVDQQVPAQPAAGSH